MSFFEMIFFDLSFSIDIESCEDCWFSNNIWIFEYFNCAKFHFQMTFSFWVMSSQSFEGVCISCSWRRTNELLLTTFSLQQSSAIPLIILFFLTLLKNWAPKVFYKKAVLKNFAIFTGNHLCWSLFLVKLQIFSLH